MTAGELARLFNETCGIGCDLRIVPVAGWTREMDFEDTGLPWVPPSPNMPAMSTARVYPGGCLIEGTTLSEGRGTTLPFELVGAPWLDARALAERLRREAGDGVAYRAASFRPMFQKHAATVCAGIQVIVTDRRRYLPFEGYLAILAAARAIGGDRFGWRTEPYEFESERLAIDLLFGNRWLREGLEEGVPVPELAARWSGALEEFRERRESYLLYR
jgi:uncharacterized protein YbbC (DUF1343 family)